MQNKKAWKHNVFKLSMRGASRIWTGDDGVADRGLTTWLSHHIKLYASYEASMTPTGIEPVLPPWKGDVLTAWPWSLMILPFPAAFVYLHLHLKIQAPQVGLEPTTLRLTAECSTDWAIEDHWRFVPSKPNTDQISLSRLLSILVKLSTD